jgi:hypothetical protein
MIRRTVEAAVPITAQYLERSGNVARARIAACMLEV